MNNTFECLLVTLKDIFETIDTEIQEEINDKDKLTMYSKYKNILENTLSKSRDEMYDIKRNMVKHCDHNFVIDTTRYDPCCTLYKCNKCEKETY